MKEILLFCLFLIISLSQAQVLPSSRSVNWGLAGYRGTIPNYSTLADITAFGGLGDGTTVNDTAFANALNSLNGNSGVIYFPAGTYLFNAPVSLPSGIIIRGAAADSTTLKFDLGGNILDAINISGTASSITALLTSNANKDSTSISVDDASGFVAGDYILLSFNDSSLMFSSWAYGTGGQVIKINAVTGNTITLESPLRRDYDVSKNPKIKKLNMVTGTGVECMKIERMDATTSQTSTIAYTYAAQCWVSGIEMYNCNFAHIEINTSTNISITGSYFHDAHAYGGGGKGYGVLCQSTTGECLTENNVFNHLRHSMLLQSGANGNVFGYNYSINAYWTEFPNNAAGDMVLHGNYPYANLFEGNIGQNIVIDNSHGINGPYNTFLRNRGELFGIFMNTNPASDNQNFIGNEVTNNGFSLGLYMLNGTGHFQHGNNVKGTIYASGTTTLTDTSYYLSGQPDFLQTSSWPSIGIPNTINSGTIPAKTRYQALNYTTCSTVLPTSVSGKIHDNTTLRLFPNPTNGLLYINSKVPADIAIYTNVGALVAEYFGIESSAPIDVSGLSKGMYIVRIKTGDKTATPVKLLIY
jgi:hypothetical protein